MIKIYPDGNMDDPAVEFDPYTPVTVTWPKYWQLLDTPLLVRFIDGDDLLEVKFHPGSGELLEIVLVNAPAIHLVDDTFSPETRPESVMVRVDPAAWARTHEFLRTYAFQDRLVVFLSREDSVRWYGIGGVLFGADSSGSLAALGISWGEQDRQSVLSR